VVGCEPEASYHPDTDLLATAGGSNRTDQRPCGDQQVRHAPSRL
jgi:hypothetical protein